MSNAPPLYILSARLTTAGATLTASRVWMIRDADLSVPSWADDYYLSLPVAITHAGTMAPRRPAIVMTLPERAPLAKTYRARTRPLQPWADPRTPKLDAQTRAPREGKYALKKRGSGEAKTGLTLSHSQK